MTFSRNAAITEGFRFMAKLPIKRTEVVYEASSLTYVVKFILKGTPTVFSIDIPTSDLLWEDLMSYLGTEVRTKYPELYI